MEIGEILLKKTLMELPFVVKDTSVESYTFEDSKNHYSQTFFTQATLSGEAASKMQSIRKGVNL